MSSYKITTLYQFNVIANQLTEEWRKNVYSRRSHGESSTSM